jgi:hypothetical protein
MTRDHRSSWYCRPISLRRLAKHGTVPYTLIDWCAARTLAFVRFCRFGKLFGHSHLHFFVNQGVILRKLGYLLANWLTLLRTRAMINEVASVV